MDRSRTNIDDTDKAIIEELQRDGRVPYTRLGAAVGLSEAAARQRVQRLIDSGVMQVVAVTNPLAHGFRRMAMIGVRTEGPTDDIAKTLQAMRDIDYLVVTADDHLWVSRAFVLLVVRWAARRGQEICPNYFLSQRALRLHDRNLYTAHELAHMVPLYGRPIYDDLRRANGRDEPWPIKYWGVGNENWGCGGNMRAEFCADNFRRYNTFVKNYSDVKVQRIACGASAGPL